MKRAMMLSMLWIGCMGLLAGCGSKEMAETPQAAAKAILELVEARDYATLFPTRYSEWYKVDKEGVPHDQAIGKLSGQFEKQYDMIVDLYTQLSSASFELGVHEYAQEMETGEKATATVTIRGQEMPFSLYRMKNGLWGFHL